MNQVWGEWAIVCGCFANLVRNLTKFPMAFDSDLWLEARKPTAVQNIELLRDRAASSHLHDGFMIES